ncbi:MAG: TIGR00730 family Rossman fold protein [Gemmatales bacterium]|nr:TIGR00730 family Rossman fold protein [Gemmatales bacterium]MDW7994632.1 TIGR00730 family Rossman fold protein [Gemmatales bacterium]
MSQGSYLSSSGKAPDNHVHVQVTVEELIREIKEAADQLLCDRADRGDVKIIATAIKELRHALSLFARYRHMRKVTIFGSARTPRDHPAYQTAVEFARRMADLGFMIITGAASGIMEAGHVGAGKERSLGINIRLPFEQAANPIIANDDQRLVNFKYFFTRKLMFVKEADAVALFPGGFGTLDEGFEALTLIQTGKSHMFPIILVDEPGGTYWRSFHQFVQDTLLKRDYISPQDLALYKVTDNVEEAVAEIRHFYRVYHSMRYIGRKHYLVLRLRSILPNELLERIRSEFADIVVEGTFELVGADPEESNDSHILHLPRLRFRFDRRNLGRLRQLIDFINREAPDPIFPDVPPAVPNL